jgi:hypothetical protein
MTSGGGAQQTEWQTSRPPKPDADRNRYTNKKIISTDSVSLARHAQAKNQRSKEAKDGTKGLAGLRYRLIGAVRRY